MYLDDLAAEIRAHIPTDRMPDGDADELLRMYAVLLRAKGSNVSCSDIHDAWAAWMATRDPRHTALVEFADLPEIVRQEDAVFARAVQQVAEKTGQAAAPRSSFAEVLFPSGPPTRDAEMQQAFDLYKVMVDSSESLVSRRQGVNTFFLSMNGALLTASGIIVELSRGEQLGGVGVTAMAVAGAILCTAWRSLITSFGQLNRGKFKVINTIERYLKAAVYSAEWEALGRGEDPKVYRSFTSREIWVPNSLLVLHALTAVVGMLFYAGVLTLGRGVPGG